MRKSNKNQNAQEEKSNAILTIVRGRSDWAQRATNVANPERVVKIEDGKLFDANGTKLRAYVNASGVALLETNAEYKIRKGIAKDAKEARKSASAQPATLAQPATAQTIAKTPSNRKNSGVAASALADAVSEPQAVEVANGFTDSPTKNSAISAITRKLETLGMDRETIEAQAGYALTDCTVRQLRKLNDVLGQRIMERAKKS